jgi:WD40 repeat protein
MRSYSAVQKIWDKVCYRPEDRLTTIDFNTVTNTIVLTSRKVNLWFFKTQDEIKTSHEYPVGVAKYNSAFENVVSCDDGGYVCTWDIENGVLISKFQAFNNGNKITSACFDKSCRRLITGTSEGEIRVWNFNNGKRLMTCVYDVDDEDDDETNKDEDEEEDNLPSLKRMEITGLRYVNASKSENIVSVGWDKRIYIWPIKDDDDDAEHIRNPILIPQDRFAHKTDITSVCYYKKSNLIFTGAQDGTLYAWNFESKKMKFGLHENDPTCVQQGLNIQALSVDCLINMKKLDILISITLD